MSGQKEFLHEPDALRYVLRIDGDVVASVDYAQGAGTVSLVRTFTRPTHRGQGLAAQIVEFAVDDIAARGDRIVPMCWYVEQWFDEHPDRKDLLA